MMNSKIDMCIIAGGFLLLVFIALLLRVKPEVEKTYEQLLYRQYIISQKKLKQISEEIIINNGKIEKAKKFLIDMVSLRKTAEHDIQVAFIKKEEDKLFITNEKNTLTKKVEILTQIEKQIDVLFETEIRENLKLSNFFKTKNIIKRFGEE